MRENLTQKQTTSITLNQMEYSWQTGSDFFVLVLEPTLNRLDIISCEHSKSPYTLSLVKDPILLGLKLDGINICKVPFPHIEIRSNNWSFENGSGE